MSLHAVDACFPTQVPLSLSRAEWDVLFASVRCRLEQAVAAAADDAPPSVAMRRMRVDVLECIEALQKLQILLAPARTGFRESQ